eukprot:4437462-Pleurochrysis_carterae.AAC.4
MLENPFSFSFTPFSVRLCTSSFVASLRAVFSYSWSAALLSCSFLRGRPAAPARPSRSFWSHMIKRGPCASCDLLLPLALLQRLGAAQTRLPAPPARAWQPSAAASARALCPRLLVAGVLPLAIVIDNLSPYRCPSPQAPTIPQRLTGTLYGCHVAPPRSPAQRLVSRLAAMAVAMVRQ